jgi:hypothetical protein
VGDDPGDPKFVSRLAGLLVLCLLVVMRSLLRNQTAAMIACVLVFALGTTPLNPSAFTVTVHLLLSALFFTVLMRFGLVAVAFVWFALFIQISFPMTFDASAWYSGFAAFAILAVVVLYAFRYSLGSRPLLAPSHLDD